MFMANITAATVGRANYDAEANFDIYYVKDTLPKHWFGQCCPLLLISQNTKCTNIVCGDH